MATSVAFKETAIRYAIRPCKYKGRCTGLSGLVGEGKREVPEGGARSAILVHFHKAISGGNELFGEKSLAGRAALPCG